MTLYRVYRDYLKNSWEVRYLAMDTLWKTTSVTYEQLESTAKYCGQDHKYCYYVR